MYMWLFILLHTGRIRIGTVIAEVHTRFNRLPEASYVHTMPHSPMGNCWATITKESKSPKVSNEIFFFILIRFERLMDNQ